MNLNYLISSVFYMFFATVPAGQSQVPPPMEFPLSTENKNACQSMELPIKHIRIALLPNTPVASYPSEFYHKNDVIKGTINLFHYLTNNPPFPLQSFDAILIPFVQGEQFMAAMDRIPYVASVMGLRFHQTTVIGNHTVVILPDGENVTIDRMHSLLKEQLTKSKTVSDVYKAKLNIDGKKVSISDIGTVIIDGINYMDTCGISYQ